VPEQLGFVSVKQNHSGSIALGHELERGTSRLQLRGKTKKNRHHTGAAAFLQHQASQSVVFSSKGKMYTA